MNRTKRAENILERLANRTGMTEEGKQWATAALDPFHDTPIDLKGIPTGESSSSVCQLVKQTMTITAPVGLTTGTWDCSIVDWPWASSISMSATIQTGAGGDTFLHSTGNLIGLPNNGTVLVPPRLITTGGLTVYKGPTGQQFGTCGMGWNNQQSGAMYGTNQLALNSTYTQGKHRVCAKGFEVHNTTASLYKGGSVTCWRSPVPDDTEMSEYNLYSINSDNTVAGYVASAMGKVFDGPPESVALALLLPNSKQWNAEQGCYCVSALHNTDVPAYEGQRVNIICEDPGYNNSVSFYGVGAPYSIPPNQLNFTSSSGIVYGYGDINVGQFDLNGAYFTGLTPQTVLTINYNIYVERFPGNTEPDLVVLANPAPERDNVALDFYVHASRSLPVGVPVNMNGLGDWFKEAISTASNFIAPALSAIPHPYAQGAGAAMKVLNGFVNGGGGAAATPSTYANTPAAAAAPPPQVVEEKIVVKPPPLPRRPPPAQQVAAARRFIGSGLSPQARRNVQMRQAGAYRQTFARGLQVRNMRAAGVIRPSGFVNFANRPLGRRRF